MATVYTVKGMRILIPKGNRKNEDVALTVKGIFHDANGNKLSIRSKDITKAQVASDEFAISLESETLTLPAGRRGKPATVGATQSELNSYLNSLKGKAKA